MADLTTLLSKFLNKLYAFDQLFSSNYTPSGIISSTGTAVATDDGNRKELWSLSLPANTLNTNGRTLRLKAWGTFAGNANQKDVFVQFGSGDFAQISTTQNGGGWQFETDIVRVSSNVQHVVTQRTNGTTVGSHYIAGSETDTAAIALAVDGTGIDANDIVLRGARLELCLDESEANAL